MIYKKGGVFSHLKFDTPDRQVWSVFQHVQVLGYEGSRVDQTLGRLCVVAMLSVLPCHVLKPRQSQVRGVLVPRGQRSKVISEAGLEMLFS